MNKKVINTIVSAAFVVTASTAMLTTVHAESTEDSSQVMNLPKSSNRSSMSKESKEEADLPAETVIYNGQSIQMKQEPDAIKNAQPVTVSGSGSEMGQQNKKTRAQCDVFDLGDASRPSQDFVDISAYQSTLDQADFNYMKSKGITGVVVKLTEGTNWRNQYARQQIAMARQAGMKVSTYHFSHFQNKAQAEAEADYYAKYARELGLGNDTLMVNDAESNELKNGYGTQNSIYFALRLINTHHFDSVLHYMPGSWCNNVLDANQLGNNSIWLAGYPYSPSKNNLWYTNREAWQFSSTMRIPNYNGTLDVNTDYTGRFTYPKAQQKVPEETPLQNTYFEVWNANGNTFNDRLIQSWRQSTKSMVGRVYEARGYITASDGAKWYSLFDMQGNWQGWTHEYDVRQKTLPQEVGMSNTYAKVWNANGNTFNDRFMQNWRQSTQSMAGHIYEVRGYIVADDGAKWYSLFDERGNWQGWTHEYDLELMEQPKEEPLKDKYAKVWNANGNTFNDRFMQSWRQSTQSMAGHVYEVRGYIVTSDGAKWYSLFDDKGNWQGWTHEYDLELMDWPQETPLTDTKFEVWNVNGNTFNDRFMQSWRQSTQSMAGHIYEARGYIVTSDGAKWYSLFDDKGNWQGWTHEYDVKPVN